MATNTGKYKLSAEAKRAHRVLCGDLNLICNQSITEAISDFESGNNKAGKEGMRVAGSAFGDAKHIGCKRAQ
jgi:hypothetical protein